MTIISVVYYDHISILYEMFKVGVHMIQSSRQGLIPSHMDALLIVNVREATLVASTGGFTVTQ